MNENAKGQIFGHFLRAASHLLRAREGAAHPASGPAPAPGGTVKAAPIKPLVLKRPPSCCAVKAGGSGHGGK